MKSDIKLRPDIRVIHGQGTREYQQDSYACQDQYFLVADGVGGNVDGDKASKVVLDTLATCAKTHTGELTQSLLMAWIEKAWEAVDQLSPGATNPPGTTLASVWLMSDNHCMAAHIGDSRIYHFRPQAITQILYRSRDDSEVDCLLATQYISPLEALRHPRRSMIMRAIIAEHRFPVMIEEGIALQEGDYLLICSDGLLENLTDEMLRFVFAPYRTLDEITDLLNLHMRLTEDNHTGIIVRMQSQALSSPGDMLDEWQDFDPTERSIMVPSSLD